MFPFSYFLAAHLLISLIQNRRLRNQHTLSESKNEYEIANYKYPQPSKEKIIIPIIHTSDIHGHALANEVNDGTNEFHVGGIDYFITYFNIINSLWDNSAIWLDSGDVFEGTFESHISKGEIMVDIMKDRVSGIALGNHDFDFEKIKKVELIKEKTLPFIGTNVFKPNTREKKMLDGILPYKIIEVKGIKIGIISLSTKDTISKIRNPIDVAISGNYKELVENMSSFLKKHKKCHAIILLSHLTFECKNGGDKNRYSIGLFDKTNINECIAAGEIGKLANSLKPGTIDLILAGHSHILGHYFINGIPFISSQDSLKYFNIAYLVFNKKNHKLESNLIKIEASIPVCNKVYKNYGRCLDFIEKEKENLGELVEFTFHGKKVRSDPETGRYLKKYRKMVKNEENKIIFTLIGDNNEVQVIPNKFKETFVNNIVVDFIKEYTHTNFSITNSGNCRKVWNVGKISKKDIYDMLPFEDRITTFEIKGEDLIKIIENIFYTDKNELYYPFSGAYLEFNRKKHKIKNFYFTNNLSQINPNETYKIGSTDFLVPIYGDDMFNLKGKIKPKKIHIQEKLRVRFTEYLTKKGKVKISEHFNPKIPRYVDENFNINP